MTEIYKKLEIGDFIIIDSRYLGRISIKLWNGNGFVVKLENDENYLDNMITQYNLLANKKPNGYMLVTPNNKIEIPNPDNLLEVIKGMILEPDYYSKINLKLNTNFNNFITNKLKTMFPTKIEQPKQIMPINPAKLRNYKIQDMNEDNYVEYIKKMIESIFTSQSNVLYEEDNTALMNISSRSIDILSEENINEVIKPTLKKILEEYRPMDMDLFYDYKKSLSFRHIILNEDDTLSFGKQLIKQIRFDLLKAQSGIEIKDGERLIDEINLFDFIKFRLVGNYLELTNRFVGDDFRVLDEQTIPGLKSFSNMYGKPIEYNMLSTIVLKNKTASDVQINQEMIKEAIDILSLEYLLCLQPKVEFLLWTINRLIFCWYSDPVLYENIFRVKILVNLYRARGIKEFNQDTDVQPLIIVIPKYGKERSTKVMSLLSYYFFPYKRFGWKESVPTYFNTLDDMMHYTNGSLELKRYIKFILGQDKEKIFTPDYTKINTGTDLNNIEYVVQEKED